MSTDTDTYERVVSILVDYLGINRNDATPKAHLIDDLGADSLDMVEMVMLIEDEFGVSIPDDIAEKINTVEDIVNQLSTL